MSGAGRNASAWRVRPGDCCHMGCALDAAREPGPPSTGSQASGRTAPAAPAGPTARGARRDRERREALAKGLIVVFRGRGTGRRCGRCSGPSASANPNSRSIRPRRVPVVAFEQTPSLRYPRCQIWQLSRYESRERDFPEFNAIVPIALSPEKERAREIHRTLLLANELSRLLGIDVANVLELKASISKRKMRVSTAAFESAYWDALYADSSVRVRRNSSRG